MIKLIPIQPKGFGEAMKRLPAAVERGMRDAAEEAKKDLEKTTKGWEHDVAFTIQQNGLDFTIGTDDEIWHWVDEGTKPHDITPKRAKRLAFAVGGQPKTRPGILVSGSGSKGTTVVIRPRVHHPGTKPRRFTEVMMKRWKRGVQPFVRAAIEDALRT